jgi:sugar phosphate isomerase/epimerase
LAERTRFIHVKDGQGTPEKPTFLLPGAGKLDLAELFRELRASNYAGDVVVEVSGQIFSRAGYDAIVSAKASYTALSKARD